MVVAGLVLLVVTTALARHSGVRKDPDGLDLQRLQFNNPDAAVPLHHAVFGGFFVGDWDKDGFPDICTFCWPSERDWCWCGIKMYHSSKATRPSSSDRVYSKGDWIENLPSDRGDARGPGVWPAGQEFSGKGIHLPKGSVTGYGGVDVGSARGDLNDDGLDDRLVFCNDRTAYGWHDNYNAKGVWLTPHHCFAYVMWGKKFTKDSPTDYRDPEPFANDNGQPMSLSGVVNCAVLKDLDGDGDLDLLTYEAPDLLLYRENVGTRQEPRFALPRDLTDARGERISMALCFGRFSLYDYDGDGQEDLLAMDEESSVCWFRRTGVRNGLPVYDKPKYLLQKADELCFGDMATPFAVDIDGDGDEDIVTGNALGEIAIIENLSGRGVEFPKWAAPKKVTTPDGKVFRIMAGANGSIQGPQESKYGYTVTTAADWDGDGKIDILFNSIWGKVMWMRNIGSGRSPRFDFPQGIEVEWTGEQPELPWGWFKPKTQANPKELITQWRTTPWPVDWNGDGLVDLVLCDADGDFALWERVREPQTDKLLLLPPKKAFRNMDGTPLRASRLVGKQYGEWLDGWGGASGRRKIAVADWNGDGKLDFIINGSDNCFLFLQRKSEHGQWFFERQKETMAKEPLWSHDPVPGVCDFNADGRPDLLFGPMDGYIYYLRNRQSPANGAHVAFRGAFQPGLAGWTLDNYDNRITFDVRDCAGERALVLTNCVKKYRDTAWSLVSGRFPVTGGADGYVRIRSFGTSRHLETPRGTDDRVCQVKWFDAKGRPVACPVRFGVRAFRERWGETYVNVKVPADAAFATVGLGCDYPNLEGGKFLAVSEIEVVVGASWTPSDEEGPWVEVTSPSPNPDLNSKIVVRVTDRTDVKWDSVRISLDGRDATESFVRNGEYFILKPKAPWEKDSLHRLRVIAEDSLGNRSEEERLVFFAEQPEGGTVSLRDDGTVLVDGKPIFPIGLHRVKKCPANGFSFETAAKQVAEAGFNFVHTYEQWKSPEHTAEYLGAMERHGLMVYSETDDSHRTNDGATLIDHIRALRGRKSVLAVKIGDDTYDFFTPDVVRRNHFFVKALDRNRLTSQADAMGPSYADRYAPYAKCSDIFEPELYPMLEPKVLGTEVARVVDDMEAIRRDWRLAGVGGKCAIGIVQHFKGWNDYNRWPTFEELRAMSWLTVIHGARGLAWYAYTGYGCSDAHGVIDDPVRWDEICRVVREIGAHKDSLSAHDAGLQPTVRIVSGPQQNAFHHPSVSCLLKDAEGRNLFLAANSTTNAVTASFTIAGRTFTERFAPYGVVIRELDVSPDETRAIQSRIDAASAAGGGRVTLGKGDHLVGSLLLKDGVELHLASGARLLGSRNAEDYVVDLSGRGLAASVTRRWANAMIRIVGAKDVAVTGEPGSEICGRNCYDAQGEEGFRGPHTITAFGVTNFVFRGCTVRDSGNFPLYAQGCAAVRVREVEIHGGHDALDFFHCTDVLVEKCRLFSGDDCVAGYGNRDLTVRDCTVNSSCSFFRLGGNGILIENCRGAAPAENPHRWSLPADAKKLETTPPGLGRRTTLSVFTFFTGAKVAQPAENVVFRNCTFAGVERLMHYNLSGNERWQQGKGLADVTFEKVTAEGLLVPVVAWGVPESPLRLTARDCRFAFREPVDAFVRGAYLGELNFSGVTVEGVNGPCVLNWEGAAPKIEARDSRGFAPETKQADIPFVCRTI